MFGVTSGLTNLKTSHLADSRSIYVALVHVRPFLQKVSQDLHNEGHGGRWSAEAYGRTRVVETRYSRIFYRRKRTCLRAETRHLSCMPYLGLPANHLRNLLANLQIHKQSVEPIESSDTAATLRTSQQWRLPAAMCAGVSPCWSAWDKSMFPPSTIALTSLSWGIKFERVGR